MRYFGSGSWPHELVPPTPIWRWSMLRVMACIDPQVDRMAGEFDVVGLARLGADLEQIAAGGVDAQAGACSGR